VLAFSLAFKPYMSTLAGVMLLQSRAWRPSDCEATASDVLEHNPLGLNRNWEVGDSQIRLDRRVSCD